MNNINDLLAVFLGDGERKKVRDEFEGIDIEKEYELIQEKKSSLPSNKRDRLVARYNRMKELEN